MFDAAPFPPPVFNSHIWLGLAGFIGAAVALSSTKGSQLHKLGGRLMIVSMGISAITALLFMFHKFSVPPVVNSIVSIYGLITAVLVLQPAARWVKRLEVVSSLVLLITFLWFLSQSIPQVISGAVIIVGPISVGLVAAIFLIGDVHYFANYQSRHRIRIRRHMVRIIWTLAVLLRAPLFELKEELGLALPVVIFTPLIVALMLTVFFWRRTSGQGLNQRA